MKKLGLLSIFLSTILSGQFFENEGYYESENASHSNYFTEPQQDTYEGRDPHPGDVDLDVPIDDWLLLLTIGGLTVGAYYLNKKQQMVL